MKTERPDPAARDQTYDERTRLVKEMTQKASAANDAKTVKLKALRLAKEEADSEIEIPKPQPAAIPRKTKRPRP